MEKPGSTEGCCALAGPALLELTVSAPNSDTRKLEGSEGNQRQVSGPLDGQPKGPLMFGADSATAARLDFGPVGDKPANPVHVLVIYDFHMIDAEGADPPAGRVSAPGTASGATAAAAWPAATAGRSWSTAGCCHSSAVPPDKSKDLEW